LYDEFAFSKVLETKGNMDHAKLIQMLDDINNYSIPIEQTFNKYFNADNYFTWMAYNILVGNVSTENTNFLLYSPKNAGKWYFIPWDYDASFPLRSWRKPGSFQTATWQVGVSSYWGNVLHNRVLRVKEFREKLDDKINQLLLFLTPEQIVEMLDTYKPVTDHYVSTLPDVYYLPGTLDEYKQLDQQLPDDVQENYQLYLQSLQRPMPFDLMAPEATADGLEFSWEPSYDINSVDITYHFEVSSDWAFNNVIYDETVVNQTLINTASLSPGEYFWRVIAINSSGKTGLPFNIYIDVDGLEHEGVRLFYISSDGYVLEP
jgi:spore coat protein H